MHVDRSLEEASANLGAGPAETFVRVTLPLSVPGIVAGSTIVFLLSTGAIITPLLLGGPRNGMLSTRSTRTSSSCSTSRKLARWPSC
jgi:putative spermidine/putrescine transport system permease protein